MKKFVKPAVTIMAFMLAGILQPAVAAAGRYSWYSALTTRAFGGTGFSAVLNRQADEELISLQIENPGRKDLSITLYDPDGAVLDVFYTGRKFIKMNKQYNFFGAREGVYSIVISDAFKNIEKKIKIERIAAAPVTRLTVQ